MATFSFADLQSVHPTIYRDIVAGVQRKAPGFRFARMTQNTTGQASTWVVTFAGQTVSAANLDGGSLPTPSADVRVPATLSHGAYATAIKVTDKAIMLGNAAGGAAHLQNLIAQGSVEAIEAMVKKLGQEFYGGAGTSNAMTGLSVAVGNSGTYAGIATASQADWASYIDGNSGTLRDLTLSMVKKATRSIAVANHQYGRPDIMLAPPAIMDKMEELFDAFTRVNYSPSQGASVGRVTYNPATITTAGGKINTDGFRVLRWENQGLTIIEDPDCKHTGQTNQTNVAYLICSAALENEVVSAEGVDGQKLAAVEQDMGNLGGLSFNLTDRGRDAFSRSFDLAVMLTPKLKHRAAAGLIADIK